MKVIATYCISNHGGIAIHDIDSDNVNFSYFDNKPEDAEIEYDDNSDVYFKCGELIIYLSECMRVNWKGFDMEAINNNLVVGFGVLATFLMLNMLTMNQNIRDLKDLTKDLSNRNCQTSMAE